MNPAHLYVHVPFCTRRCSYCSFHIAVRRAVPADEYVRGIAAELEIRFPDRDRWQLRTVYLGGGTPSRLGPAGISKLLEVIRSHAEIADEHEITIEVNPEDVTADAAAEWKGAGINRVSVGVQTLSDAALSWMHRVHDAAAARRALDVLARHFERVSADLIFALPSALSRDLSGEIRELSSRGAAHISIYGMTVEQGTPFARWIARGSSEEAPEDAYVSDYLLIHETLHELGYQHYEVSNHGRTGHRAAHNSAYWTGAPYAGVGPAAHGFDGRIRRWNEPEYAAWQNQVDSRRDPLEGQELLTAENRIAEDVYLGLRVVEGLLLRDGEEVVVEPWLRSGWGVLEERILRLTPQGWLRLDALAAALTAIRSR